jgi:uroporphyrinogen-III synthase
MKPEPKAGALSGRGILITRPKEHAAGLAERIGRSGGDPILFPAIEIAPPQEHESLARLIARLERFDLAIFISETAVAKGCEAVLAVRSWPETLRVAAVGGSTARGLERAGFRSVLAPEEHADSESLAALPELREVRGKSIVIFRGEGGREWLRGELEARGAQVEYAECYRRLRPAGAGLEPLLARWRRGGVDAVSITSGEGLSNLFDLLGPEGRDRLRATPVFVPHPRIAEAARKLGVRVVVVTAAGEESAADAMAEFFARV